MPYGDKDSYSFFKMKGSPMQRNFGIGSPLKHPHRTAKEAYSHDKDQPHPPSDITPETVVDDSGKKVDKPKAKNAEKNNNKGLKEGVKRSNPIKPTKVIQMPNPDVRPPGWGLDR